MYIYIYIYILDNIIYTYLPSIYSIYRLYNNCIINNNIFVCIILSDIFTYTYTYMQI